MSEPSPAPMTVDEFLLWAEGQPGRHELVDGRVCAMAPERAGHARAKIRAQRALEDAIGRVGPPCEAMGDGMTVRVDARTAYEPDALVYCGPRLPRNDVVVPAPGVVVEVLSPSTGFFDRHGKLSGYFAVPSLRHYLIVDIDRRMVIHHARDGDEIRTRLVPAGALRLDPPGLDRWTSTPPRCSTRTDARVHGRAGPRIRASPGQPLERFHAVWRMTAPRV